MAEMNLTTAFQELYDLRAALDHHTQAAATEAARLRAEIQRRETTIATAEAGLDAAKIALAKTIVFASDYSRGGKDRASARADAIKQLASGRPVRKHYGDLWRVFFGTKNYDQWSGQRCDCEYGCGPRHGSICFRIGLTDAARKRRQADLSADEVEAAIYYLVNLERVQEAERVAAAKAAA